MQQPIKLLDGTELVPLEDKDKEALELELKAVLDKYNAVYLPVIKKSETIAEVKQTAVLFLLKKVIPSPYNGESNDTKETPETK